MFRCKNDLWIIPLLWICSFGLVFSAGFDAGFYAMVITAAVTALSFI